MYQYNAQDQRIVEERAQQFRQQVARRIAGDISELEFKPLRLQNGLYMQLHAYMLRVAVPYGLLSSAQLRKLAHIARTYDRGYGHLTTRQNMQFNWPSLEDVPRILDDLATVQMHAIQTSGNCIRNVTSDPLAGVALDEIEDPRPYCEIIRQWSTFHPEFAFLPRKFKIAVTGAREDRAAIAFHDIGLRLVQKDDGEVGFAVYVGGGQGRTPVIAAKIRDFLPKVDLLSYCEAILRVYNQHGRRDNKYKARIKILVSALGAEKFAELVDSEWAEIRESGLKLRPEEISAVSAHFTPPAYDDLAHEEAQRDQAIVHGALMAKDRRFAQWYSANTFAHRVPGYRIVGISCKSKDLPPGDITAEQMDEVASLAESFSLGRLVITHRQNIVLTDVRQRDLPALHTALAAAGLATANYDKLTDIIACPGLDYCNLANARSINIAEDLQHRFSELDRVYQLGDLTLNISGCINACGHHHVGHIGILGIDKQGVEHYQLTLGGNPGNEASIGKILGRALTEAEIGPAVEKVVDTYASLRVDHNEPFLSTYRRVGAAPFKEAVYG